MNSELKESIDIDLKAKQEIVIQVRDDEIDGLMEAFPGAILVEKVNNYSNFYITTRPVESETATSPIEETLYRGYYRDQFYFSKDLKNQDEVSTFRLEYNQFAPQIFQYSRNKPEKELTGQWPACQCISLITFYEKGHWCRITKSDWQDNVQSFANRKQKNGIECTVVQYFYAGKIEG